jgi:hypothetical protein
MKNQMDKIFEKVDSIRSFAQSDFINEDNTSYLLGDVENENWEDAWQFLHETEQTVRELLENIVEAKVLIGERLALSEMVHE